MPRTITIQCDRCSRPCNGGRRATLRLTRGKLPGKEARRNHDSIIDLCDNCRVDLCSWLAASPARSRS